MPRRCWGSRQAQAVPLHSWLHGLQDAARCMPARHARCCSRRTALQMTASAAGEPSHSWERANASLDARSQVERQGGSCAHARRARAWLPEGSGGPPCTHAGAMQLGSLSKGEHFSATRMALVSLHAPQRPGALARVVSKVQLALALHASSAASWLQVTSSAKDCTGRGCAWLGARSSGVPCDA